VATGLVGGLVAGLVFGPAFRLVAHAFDPTFTLPRALAVGVVAGLVFGLIGGLVFGLAGELTGHAPPDRVRDPPTHHRGMKNPVLRPHETRGTPASPGWTVQIVG
jgi:hypothetical protein